MRSHLPTTPIAQPAAPASEVQALADELEHHHGRSPITALIEAITNADALIAFADDWDYCAEWDAAAGTQRAAVEADEEADWNEPHGYWLKSATYERDALRAAEARAAVMAGIACWVNGDIPF